MEQSHSENTKRIAKNTLMLYGRMLFSMLVSLYTSRVVLNTLGVVDYGIYGAVGGFVAMFSLISSSLSSAVSRFLTFELGRGNQERLNKVFSTSLLIHIALAIVVLIVAETIGVWFVNNKMTIPLDRIYAANWVFQASIFSFMFGLFSVPYNASIVAHEKMSTFAYIGILDTTLRLLIVLFIAYSKWHFDKLIVYSLLLVAVSISLQCVYLSYCRRIFSECRFRIGFDKEFWKEISSFAGWNFIGCTAQLLKDHGVNIVLNIFNGPVLNAARGVATSVNTAVSSFTGSFMSALNPQITKSYAIKDNEYLMFLVERGARFSFYILMILAFPIIIETEYILSLWLVGYPDHSVNFVRLVLLMSLIETISNTLITLQLATGKIRNYQLAVGGVLFLNFPLSYFALRIQLPPESVYVIAIVVAVLCLILRLFFLRRMVGLSVFRFAKNVLFNVILVSTVAVILPYCVHCCLKYGAMRFLTVGFLSVISSIFSILFIGCSKNERLVILGKILRIKQYNND